MAKKLRWGRKEDFNEKDNTDTDYDWNGSDGQDDTEREDKSLRGISHSDPHFIDKALGKKSSVKGSTKVNLGKRSRLAAIFGKRHKK